MGRVDVNNRLRAAAAAAAAAALAAGLAACSPEEPDGHDRSGKHYYVSLGDSLAVGVQPTADGGLEETRDGYTDVLYRRLYDRDSTLEHRRMGCGGEDTTTFVEGGTDLCEGRYAEESQLAAAERFLGRHRDRVDLVTVGIGANNFTGCVLDAVEGAEGTEGAGAEPSAGSGVVTGLDGIDRDCVADGLERLEAELPVIARRLRGAAGPDTRIVGMTYYNPFLAALLLEDAGAAGAGPGTGGADGAAGAEPRRSEAVDYATGVFEDMNRVITDAYTAEDIAVADVAGAFASGDTSVPAGSETGMPANVERVCDHTWMCNLAVGPDIHTNPAGAALIADAFEAELGRP
ncbi:lysophospholipase L1-like esterase [Streptomonospora nanhaiensis]|uniref:Lysophospholipase L1-like esterase n=1 Tax=Streptomonospora nanhaiensis TaxID=1323731 RepID=A0A853BNS2_9ACTN|nr:GDSL-type esterase/lipase family protein [Streptomonospora nanhaiensis]NYI96161.1 lysophospholipase L1-like esterase [Streptomonospora nanhaiensis]